MKIISIFILLVVSMGCHSSTTTSVSQAQCIFSKTLLLRDSTLETKFPADSTRTYTYSTFNVSFDSLLQALCSKGFMISEAWNSNRNSYICLDLIGPRPVIVLRVSDSTIFKYGFVQGNHGRLSCSTSLYYYKPE